MTRLWVVGCGLSVALLVGCGVGGGSRAGVGAAVPSAVVAGGAVHGGQQPIAGAAMYLYAANANGYGAANVNILTEPVLTDGNGYFSLDGKYSCTAGQQMYLVAVGGNPGAGVNANSALMAALGDCSTLSGPRFISVNELTTVASAFALSPFMSGYAGLGTSATNMAGMVRAFVSVNKLVNTGTGTTGGPALAAGATVPAVAMNTLADALAYCVNSTGGLAGTQTPCGTLFTLATPVNGVAPTDTIGAALVLAKNPTLSLAAITNLVTPTAPFQPTFASAPRDWTLAITYTGFSKPRSTSVDANGNVWVANEGNNTVTVLAQTGVPVGPALSGNGLNAPSAVALDSSGNAWVANRGGTVVSVFTNAGGVVAGSPFAATGMGAASALAIDARDHVWVTDKAGSAVWEFTGQGAVVQKVTSGVLLSPVGIVVAPN